MNGACEMSIGIHKKIDVDEVVACWVQRPNVEVMRSKVVGQCTPTAKG